MSTSGILKVNKNGKYKYYYVSGDAFPEALKPEISYDDYDDEYANFYKR